MTQLDLQNPEYDGSPTTLTHSHFQWTRKETAKGTTSVYRCKNVRKVNESCKATLTMDFKDAENTTYRRNNTDHHEFCKSEALG